MTFLYRIATSCMNFLLENPSTLNNENAMLALASLAAVLWTGGIISIQMQVERARSKAVVGMNFLQFGFILPVFALFAAPRELRAIVILAAFFYLIKAIMIARKSIIADRVRGLYLRNLPKNLDPKVISKSMRFYSINTFGVVILFIPIVCWPTQITVAWISGISIMLGLKTILNFLNAD